jgi:hypothetical protein
VATTRATSPKEEYIANAYAVGKKTSQRIEALVSDLPEDTTAEEAQITVDDAIPLFRDQIEQLRDYGFQECGA